MSRGKPWRLAVSWGLAFLFLPVGPALAAVRNEPWEIVADRISRYEDPDYVIAEGHVVLQRPPGAGGDPILIKADWMRYDVTLGMVKARGHIFFESTAERIEAAAAKLDLNQQTGTLTDATLVLPQEEYDLTIAGAEIKKTGEISYEIEEALISSCPAVTGKSRPWQITSQRVRVKKDGMAVLRNASLEIKDKPVAYTPYMTFPAKTKRESGFLMPEVSLGSRDGFGLIAPYFVNLSPSHDVTLYPGYLDKRGMLYGIEFRYMLDSDSHGAFALTHLRDRTEDRPATDGLPADEYLADGILRTNHNRYWLRGKADHDFGNKLTGKLDIDFVSDQDYLSEFRGGVTGFDASDRYFLKYFNRGFQEETVTSRDSTLQLVKTWPAMQLSGALEVAQNVKEPVVGTLAPTSSELQSLPRVQFTGRLPLFELPASLTWDSEYIYRWRERGIGYHRADLHPEVVWSLPRGVLEGTVTGGVRQTMYLIETHGDPAVHTWNYDRSQSRTVQNYKVDVASTWMRDFEMGGAGIQSLRHTIRPNVIYEYIPSVYQLTLPKLDSTDRIDPVNEVRYVWNNYFDATGGGRKWGLGLVAVEQTYDIYEVRRKLKGRTDFRRPFSDVLLKTELQPIRPLKMAYESAWSVYDKGNTYYRLQGSYIQGEVHKLTVDYTYKKDPKVRKPYYYSDRETESQKKISLALKSELTATLTVDGQLDQIWQDENNRVDESVRILYHPGCWAVALLASKTDDDRRIGIVFSLTGIGDLVGVGLMEDSFVRYDVL